MIQGLLLDHLRLGSASKYMSGFCIDLPSSIVCVPILWALASSRGQALRERMGGSLHLVCHRQSRSSTGTPPPPVRLLHASEIEMKNDEEP